MRIHLKKVDAFKFECWIEDYCSFSERFKTVCDAKLILVDTTLLIDDLATEPGFKRQGYASAMIQKLKEFCKVKGWDLKAYGIVNRPAAIAFWNKHGIEDAYGKVSVDES